MMQATLTFKIYAEGGKDARGWLVDYGVAHSLGPMPLNSIINNMQVSVKKNTIRMQVAEILPMLLRMYDPETIAKYDNLTPTTLDQLSDYADVVIKLPFAIAGGLVAKILY